MLRDLSTRTGSSQCQVLQEGGKEFTQQWCQVLQDDDGNAKCFAVWQKVLNVKKIHYNPEHICIARHNKRLRVTRSRS